MEQLVRRVEQDGVLEVILATNPSMEGEVTATYIQQLLVGLRGAGHPARARACPWAASWNTSTR